MTTSIRPALKWPGGKRRLLPEILPRIPKHVHTYIEPFIGGGAVFFTLAAERRFDHAIISDADYELIATYRGIRDDPDGVADRFAEIPQNREKYYEIRAQDWRTMSDVQIAARMIYLNRCAFNGLRRKNRRGQDNAPWGGDQRRKVLDRENLHACAAVLHDVDIWSGDFEGVMSEAQAGDFVYCDPPYWPISATSCFCSYGVGTFGPSDHARLAAAFRALGERGASGLLSNSAAPEAVALYEGLHVDRIIAPRSLNTRSERKAVEELLVSVGPAAQSACERCPMGELCEYGAGFARLARLCDERASCCGCAVDEHLATHCRDDMCGTCPISAACTHGQPERCAFLTCPRHWRGVR